MEKITKREMFEAVINTMKTGECPYAPEDVIAFCENEIEQLDKKAAKAKARAAAKAAEVDALYELVAGALTADEYHPIGEIAVAVAVQDPEATPAKITNRLTKMVNAGLVEKAEITVESADGSKKRKVQGYRLMVTED